MKKNNLLILELLCGITLFVTMFTLAITGAYKNYVTPKMKPYLFFVCIVLAVWIGYDVRLLIKKETKSSVTNLLLFAVPVVIILISLPTVIKVVPKPKTESEEISQYNEESRAHSPNVNAGEQSPSSESAPMILQDDPGNVDSSKASVCDKINRMTDPFKPEDKKDTILYGYDEANKTLVISDDEFSGWLDQTMSNPDKYVGVQVTVKGQVMYDPEYFKEGQFSPIRQLMTCCVADLAPIGYVCQYDDVKSLKEDDWVEVTGTFVMGKYQGEDDLQIKVTSVKPANPSDQKYVYPVY